MEKIGNFILKLFELLKSDPQTAIAKYLIGASLVLLVGIGSLTYTYKEHSLQYADEANIMGYFLLAIGIIMLIHRYITIKNNAVSLAYGIGIKGMNIHTPLEAIPKYERFDCIEIDLETIDSYDRNTVIENYKFNKKLLENRIQNKSSKKIYVGALGSFPYLFLLGSLFRNAYSNVSILDYSRHANGGGKWYKLPFISNKNEDIHHVLVSGDMTIDKKIQELNDKDNVEVGIALGYTFSSNINAIPSELQDNILYLNHSYGIGHDMLSNEESQRRLLYELSTYMASLWSHHQKIHLFVSAQASVCINIGKSYMNNAHGVLVLHNYDNSSKTYNWSIEFDRGEII